jgi:hypothetical protein
MKAARGNAERNKNDSVIINLIYTAGSGLEIALGS